MRTVAMLVMAVSVGMCGIAQAGQIIVAGPIGSSQVENTAVCYVANLSDEYKTIRWSYIRRSGEPYEEILEIEFVPYETKRIDTEDLQASLCVMEVEGNPEVWRMLGCNLDEFPPDCKNTVEGRMVPGFKWPEVWINQ